MVRYVAGDIGGTNSRLQLIETKHIQQDGEVEDVKTLQHEEVLIAEEKYESQKYSSLTFIIEKFLHQYCSDGDWPVACCLAVAGPVRANKAQITNVNWSLDALEMSRVLRIPQVKLINDFVGVGFGLLALERQDVVAINDTPAIAEAPKCCIGAGTGLGEAFLTWNGNEYDVWASEGGHADFAPRDEVEFKLLEFLKKTERVPRVSVERVVSGMGIPKIYDYFCHAHPQEISPEVTKELQAGDAGKVIAQHAEAATNSLCRQSIETFVKAYGAEAGNCALKYLPFGGFYVAGGIAAKILWAIQKDHLFWNNFCDKGRMRGLLERVPLYIVTNPNVGLLGAKVVARRMLRKEGFHVKGELHEFPQSAPKTITDFGTLLPDLHVEATVQPNSVEKVVLRRLSTNAHFTDSTSNNSNLTSLSNSSSLSTVTHDHNPHVVITRSQPSHHHHHSSSSSSAVTEATALKAGFIGGLLASIATTSLITLSVLLWNKRKA